MNTFTIRSRQQIRAGAAVLVSLCALTFLTGCLDDESESPPPDAQAQESQPSEELPSREADDEELPVPDDLPDSVPDIGIPFYVPSTLMAYPQDGDDMWVLEFVTDDELTVVNSFIEDNVVAERGWSDVEREVNDQMTVTHAAQPGYELTIAVAPERVDDSKTELFYTLRSE